MVLLAEPVVVVPESAVAHLPAGLSTRRQPGWQLAWRLMTGSWQVLPRATTEAPGLGFRQLIPYVVTWTGGPGHRQVFATRRLPASGEPRLHGLVSIGIGGHMNPVAGCTDLGQLLAENARREMAEEVSGWPPGIILPQPTALLRLDDSDVDRVHLGAVIPLRLPTAPPLQVLEADKLAGNWKPLAALRQLQLETWAALLTASDGWW